MQDCSESNLTSFICLTPNVTKYQRLLSTQPTKRDVEENIRHVAFRLSLVLDGYLKYDEENFPKELPLFENFTFVAYTPQIVKWDKIKEFKGGDSITIHGKQVSHDRGRFSRSQLRNSDVLRKH